MSANLSLQLETKQNAELRSQPPVKTKAEIEQELKRLELELKKHRFYLKIEDMWENEAFNQKILEKFAGKSPQQILMQSHPEFFFTSDDDNEALTIISDDYARLGREDVVAFCADLRDPNKQAETFLKLKDLYEKTQDIAIATLLSICYDQGLGTIIDREKSWDLDLALKKEGSPYACFIVAGRMKDLKKGQELRAAALNQQDFFSVFSLYGIMLLHGDRNKDIGINEDSAIELLTQAAEKQQSIACANLCNYYFKNLKNKQLSNVAENLYKYAKKLSDSGHATGNYYLALCYAQGIGVPQNTSEYFRLLCDAAEKFSQLALAQLAFDYLHGIEGFLNPDPIQGIKYYMRALYNGFPIFDTDFDHFRRYADNTEFMTLAYQYCCNILEGYSLGDAASCLAMGGLFENGLLVQKDLNRALKCYKKSFQIDKNSKAADCIAKLGSQGVGEISTVVAYFQAGYCREDTKTVREQIKSFTTVYDGLQASLGETLPKTLLKMVADYAYTPPEVPATGNNGTTTDAAGNEDPDKTKSTANAAP